MAIDELKGLSSGNIVARSWGMSYSRKSVVRNNATTSLATDKVEKGALPFGPL